MAFGLLLVLTFWPFSHAPINDFFHRVNPIFQIFCPPALRQCAAALSAKNFQSSSMVIWS